MEKREQNTGNVRKGKEPEFSKLIKDTDQRFRELSEVYPV